MTKMFPSSTGTIQTFRSQNQCGTTLAAPRAAGSTEKVAISRPTLGKSLGINHGSRFLRELSFRDQHEDSGLESTLNRHVTKRAAPFSRDRRR